MTLRRGGLILAVSSLIVFVVLVLPYLILAQLNDPLPEAIVRGDIHAVRRMIAERADVNQPARHAPIFSGVREYAWDPGDDPITIAARHKQREILKLLLENGADPNHQATDSDLLIYNALLCAMSNNDLESVELLLSHGAIVHSPSMVRAFNLNPLNIALLRRVREAGFDVNADAGQWYGTLLNRAALNQNPISVLILLLHGADPNQVVEKDYYQGKTPLHVAAGNRDVLMFSLLLKFGANPFDKNKAGLTPIDILWDQSRAVLREWFPRR